jgi:fused signal recognition particle receptor
MRLFEKFKTGLEKTRANITDKIDQLINNYGEIDDSLLDDLEEILVMADIGMNQSMMLIEDLKEELKKRKIKDSSLLKSVLKDVIETRLGENILLDFEKSPQIIIVIGVNGAGKTTTIGKLSNRFKNSGKTVLVAAADTFRAAAIDQLKIWTNRAGVDIVAHKEGSDPGAVVFDAISAAKARNIDVLICDTAGRLHNKQHLMNELSKIFKIIDSEYSNASKEVLLVLDGTTGQNAINQAKSFKEVVSIDGLVITKLDGSAKGGFVLSIANELSIPVKLVGVGEKIDDLEDFDKDAFVKALLDLEND